jgi:hypothetical protein
LHGGLPLTSQAGRRHRPVADRLQGGRALLADHRRQRHERPEADQVAGSVGTQGPLTITPTPRGLAYISPDGLRIIDPVSAMSSEPIGANGQGVTLPFIFGDPSRMCAAFNKNIYRVSVQNGAIDGQPVQEWWYHFSLGIFTGPHDFPAAIIAPATRPIPISCCSPAALTASFGKARSRPPRRRPTPRTARS